MRIKTRLGAVMGAMLFLTACSGNFSTLEELVEDINANTSVECDISTVEPGYATVDNSLTWSSVDCSPHSYLYFTNGPDAVSINIDAIDRGGSLVDSQLTYGDNWFYFADDPEAVFEIHERLNGLHPSFSEADSPKASKNSPSPSPTPSPDPIETGFVLSCGYGGDDFPSYEAIWEALDVEERYLCRGEWAHDDEDEAAANHDYSENELEALDLTGLMKSELPDLYGLCASVELGRSEHAYSWRDEPFYTGYSSDKAEVDGAFLLCPDHPDRELVETSMQEANSIMEERESGDRFGAGLKRVNEDIRPGTYVVEEENGFDGCYWERLDAAGNILGNNFIQSGYRAEVTIQGTDFSFSSTRCGEWVRQ